MAAKNVYANIHELIKDYYSQPVDDYLDQTVTINGVSLDCDIYRVANNSELTASVFTGCVANDANTQIIIGSNLSIADGITLTPPYRCKGIIIGCPGTFTNAGTISMTARGASAAGIDIPLIGEHKISATGGTGGTAVVADGNNYTTGHAGSSPASSVISCGGGGSGSCHSGTSGAGGVGTCFSGGAGGGAMCNGVSNATNGSSTGGAGGNGSAGNYHVVARSGAGNPVGTENTSGYSSQYTQYFDTNGTGTGGLIILMANFIVNTGSIVSEGSKGPGYPGGGNPGSVMGGGASGGGCICFISQNSSSTGTISTAGGAQSDVAGGGTYNIKGGAGGAGTYANLTVEDLVLADPTELQLGLTVRSALDNIEPVSGRLMGLIDDNELMYEYQGTRHRAMNTDVDLSVIHAPGMRTPDEFEVAINNPQEGQVMKYNATTEQWENGDAASGLHEYSTEEKVVGTWIDGRNVYERTFSGLNIAATQNAWTDVLLNLGDLNYISCKCYRTDSINYFMDVQFKAAQIYQGTLMINTFETRTIGLVILQYLKNTDTV